MGLFTFIKEAGQAIGIGDSGEKAADAESKAALEAVMEKKRGKALADMVTKVGIPVTDLAVEVKGAAATVRGTVGTQEAREKIVLLVGNTRGIESVDDQLKFGAVATATAGMPSGPGAAATTTAAATMTSATPPPAPAEPAATFYTVKSGDSLSKIAKAHYGSASKYPVIFEANKPMLSDPDKIYPGQVLRIPPQANA